MYKLLSTILLVSVLIIMAACSDETTTTPAKDPIEFTNANKRWNTLR